MIYKTNHGFHMHKLCFRPLLASRIFPIFDHKEKVIPQTGSPRGLVAQKMRATLSIEAEYIEELAAVADIAAVAVPVVVDNSFVTGIRTTDAAMMDVAQSFHQAPLADPLHPRT
jgi:hypothetical protein